MFKIIISLLIFACTKGIGAFNVSIYAEGDETQVAPLCFAQLTDSQVQTFTEGLLYDINTLAAFIRPLDEDSLLKGKIITFSRTSISNEFEIKNDGDDFDEKLKEVCRYFEMHKKTSFVGCIFLIYQRPEADPLAQESRTGSILSAVRALAAATDEDCKKVRELLAAGEIITLESFSSALQNKEPVKLFTAIQDGPKIPNKECEEFRVENDTLRKKLEEAEKRILELELSNQGRTDKAGKVDQEVKKIEERDKTKQRVIEKLLNELRAKNKELTEEIKNIKSDAHSDKAHITRLEEEIAALQRCAAKNIQEIAELQEELRLAKVSLEAERVKSAKILSMLDEKEKKEKKENNRLIEELEKAVKNLGELKESIKATKTSGEDSDSSDTE